MIQLTESAHQIIKEHCSKGDSLADAEEWSKSLEMYWKAWDTIPEPRENYEASTWILAAIGDVNFLSGDFEAGRDNLSNSMYYLEAIGNPFIHLRLGQCQYEIGNMDRAADELTRAFMSEGKKIFEDEDPKYFEFLKTKLENID